MKNLLKLNVLFVLFFLNSCSSEDLITNPNDYIKIKTENSSISSRSEMTINELARNIYFDVDFNKYLDKKIEHFDKINVNANKDEVLNFESEDELDSWIINNIQKTSFKNIEEYENSKLMLENLKNIYLIKFSDKLELFRNYVNFKVEFEEALFLIDEQENQDEFFYETNGAQSCVYYYSRCVNRAQRNAAMGLAVSIVSAYFNPFVGAAGALATRYYLSTALEACQDSYEQCMN
jgi:hypothetical protein